MKPAYFFTKNNCRMRMVTDKEAVALSNDKNCVISPDLSKVVGVEPHFWKLAKNGEVVPMTPFERKHRIDHHNEHGVDNEVAVPPVLPTWKDHVRRLAPVGWAAAGAALVYAATHFT